MQPTLFNLDEFPPEWHRIPGIDGGTCGAQWVHRSGWRVVHCGHPTALWPYAGLPPGEDGKYRSGLLLTGGMGLGIGFQHLADAKAAVLRQLAQAPEEEVT